MSHEEITKQLELVGHVGSLSERLDQISSHLLGSKYQSDPLIGSSSETESFVVATDSFDCVTYCEHCLAVANTTTADDYSSYLQRLRYEKGNIEWKDRNHYMYEWIRNNLDCGFLIEPLKEKHEIKVHKTLSLLENYPHIDAELSYISPESLQANSKDIHTGDIVFFGSNRDDLDVFHMGILIVYDNEIRLRHASKSIGTVSEETLDNFLSRNETSGLIVVRPASVKETL